MEIVYKFLHLILICVVLFGGSDGVARLQFIVICSYVVPVISEDLVKGALMKRLM